MKCPECGGKGYKEYEAGLIQVPCATCKATGEVPGWKLDQILKREGKTNDNPTDDGTTFTPNLRYHENVAEAKKKIEALDDSANRVGPDNFPTRGADTRKPSKPKKRRTKKKTAKKSR